MSRVCAIALYPAGWLGVTGLWLREVGENPGGGGKGTLAMALVTGQVKVRGKASHLQHLECVAAHRHSLAFGEYVGLVQREGAGAGAEGACIWDLRIDSSSLRQYIFNLRLAYKC